MLTQCPNCDAYFRIRADELAAADGRVRCGNCRSEFDALHNLHDDDSAPRLDTPKKTTSEVDADATEKTPPSVERSTYDILQQAAQSTSEHDQSSQSKGETGSSTGWVLGVVLLIGLFIAQYSWFHNGELIQRVPELRPAIQWFCGLTGCVIPERRDLAALHVVARDIREHPRFKRVLLVNTTIQNDAKFQQRFPDLQLEMFDTGGAPVGGRRFSPEEYLDPSVDIPAGMGPGRTGTCSFGDRRTG